MINTTILSLNILSLASYSPFYTMYNINKGILCFSLCNSQISYLFNSVIQSYTRNHQTLIKNTIISHTLNSAIKFSSEGETSSCSIFPNFPFESNTPIDNKEFNGKTCDADKDCHLSFKGDCGDLIITKCTFEGCHSKESGGSISIIQDCSVTIHGTIFNDSKTTDGRYGGAVFIVKSLGKGYDDPKWADISNGEIKKLDVQYCCFSNCYGSNILMGVAVLCSADQMMLYFASTTNCPGDSKNKAEGAQFDIQARNVTSHHVNCSGGYSNYCGGIEYRYASTGFFKYQTITGITCMFGISYTKLTEKSALENGIELSDSNIIGIKLERANGLKDDGLYSGLIHVRQTKKISIKNFCFIDSTLDGTDRIISKGTEGGNMQNIIVEFDNCFYDCENKMIAIETQAEKLIMINCVENTKTLNEIDQLLLGECQGNEEPVPFTPTNSKEFSNSDYFTKSKYFTNSDYFTYSQKFDETEFFSKSGIFTESISFTSNDPPGKSVDKDKSNAGMIAGISVGAVAAVAIIGLVAFFIIRKRRMIPDGNDLETFDENTGSVTNSNPIYGKGEDDPFKEDFK